MAYVLAGNYGPVAALGTLKCVGLVLQLVASGFVILMLDDLLGKGWGLGSGLNLFIVTNICESVVWACLSPMTVTGANGLQMEGAIVNFIYMMVRREGVWRGAVVRASVAAHDPTHPLLPPSPPVCVDEQVEGPLRLLFPRGPAELV